MEELSLALQMKCWWGVNKYFLKRFSRKIRRLGRPGRQASNLSERLHAYRNKHLVLLGSSMSALKYEEYCINSGKPDNHVVIGCNFTNYLDSDIDIYISAHLIACCVAQKSRRKPRLIINPNPTGLNPSAGIYGVQRKNFGEDVSKVKAMSKDAERLCLYTNQNVLFLMLSLSYYLSPASITFCGFEAIEAKHLSKRFFQKSPQLMNEIFSDMISLEEIYLMGHSYTCAANEMLSLAYNYFWVPLLQCVLDDDVSEPEDRADHVANAWVMRERYIEEFLNADHHEVPLYRFGETTLFSKLPLSPHII